MSAADVAKAVQWSQQTGLKLDMVYNGAGNEQYRGAPPTAAGPLQQQQEQFRWINHTFEHPNLDCSTQSFIPNQITQNSTWATRTASVPVDSAELVTGEHSGLANTIPATRARSTRRRSRVSPPARAARSRLARTSTASPRARARRDPGVHSVTTAAAGGVEREWGAVCKATGYDVYRRSPAGAWERIGTVAQPANPFTDAGAVTLYFTDTGAAAPRRAPRPATPRRSTPTGRTRRSSER